MQVAVVQQKMRLRELWSASDVPWRRLCQAVQHQRMGGCFYPHAQSLPAASFSGTGAHGLACAARRTTPVAATST